MNPMDVLQPNYMGAEYENTGMDSLTVNMGWGVAEASPPKEENGMLEKVKLAHAKQFGKKVEDV